MTIRLLNSLKHSKSYQSSPFHFFQLVHHYEDMIQEDYVVMIVSEIQLFVDCGICGDEGLRESIAIED